MAILFGTYSCPIYNLQAANLMEVLIKWCRKRYGLDPNPPQQPPEKRAKLDGQDEETNDESERVPELEPEINLMKPQKPFLEYLKWDHNDGDFFLNRVHGKQIMNLEDENTALEQILQSCVEERPLKPVRATPSPRTSSSSRTSASGGRPRPGPKRRRY